MEISANQTKNMLNYSDILHVVGSKNFYEEHTPSVFMDTPPSSILFLIKLLLMGFIIIAAIFGNLLVIVSVMRHRKLR